MTKTFSSKKLAIGYGLLLVLAIILRVYQLNIPMLGEQEAAIALQASGSPINNADGLSGMVSLLAPILFLFGKSETAARLISAIFGAAIIFAPFYFRRILGNKTAVALSILIMFDPALTAYSRQVDGAIIAVCGLVFTAAFLMNCKFIGAGIAAAFALLVSPTIWPGLLAAGLALWLIFRKRNDPAEGMDEVSHQPVISKSDLIAAGIALILTVVLIGSAFLTRLIGITAPFTNLSAFIQGWTNPSGVSIPMMILAFFLYEPFVLFSGLFEGIRADRADDRLGRFLLWWFLFAVILAVVYPSRGFNSFVFINIPLLTLSARCIIRIIESVEKPDIPAYGQMALTLLLIPFSWMNVLAISFPIEGQEEALRAAAAAGGLLLLVIATILIRMGWPSKQCWTGLWMGLAVLLSVCTISTAWRSAGLGKNPEAEVWNYNGVTSEMDLLQKTAGDLSEWTVASRTGINIVVLNYPSATLKWALRDFSSVSDLRSIPNLSNPSIVITANEEVPSLAKAYRGQDFALARRTNWDLILPEEWIKWIAWREVPSDQQQVILWARTDLFPGAEKTAPTTITPLQ